MGKGLQRTLMNISHYHALKILTIITETLTNPQRAQRGVCGKNSFGYHRKKIPKARTRVAPIVSVVDYHHPTTR